MSDRKKNFILCILIVLIAILITTTVWAVTKIKEHKEEQILLKNQVQRLIDEIRNKEEVAVNLNEENKSEEDKDLNEERADNIRKLVLEQMPAIDFRDTVSADKYKVIGKYINKIEIYNEPYFNVALEEGYSFNEVMQETRYGVIEAIGKVAFSTEFDKKIDTADLVLAGGARSIMIHENYLVQEFVFTLWKTNDGGYKLEIGTGR